MIHPSREMFYHVLNYVVYFKANFQLNILFYFHEAEYKCPDKKGPGDFLCIKIALENLNLTRVTRFVANTSRETVWLGTRKATIAPGLTHPDRIFRMVLVRNLAKCKSDQAQFRNGGYTRKTPLSDEEARRQDVIQTTAAIFCD